MSEPKFNIGAWVRIIEGNQGGIVVSSRPLGGAYHYVVQTQVSLDGRLCDSYAIWRETELEPLGTYPFEEIPALQMI